jgi:hypothetical protein
MALSVLIGKQKEPNMVIGPKYDEKGRPFSS